MEIKNKAIRTIYKTLMEVLHPGRTNYLDMIDLSKVPEKELRDHYVDYRFFARKSSFCNMFVPVAEGYASSSSDKTEDPDSVISSLIDKYGFSKKWQVTKVMRANDISVLTVVADIEENLQMVNDDMDKAGYFLGFRKTLNIKGMQWQIVQFEPMFEFDQTESLKKYNIAYHWTPQYNLQSILDDGFIPKTINKGFNYPPRIYFLNGAAPNDEIMKLGENLCIVNKNLENDGNYVLIKINTEKIPENVKFYFDPSMPNAMYTIDPIPANVITDITEYNFKDNEKK